MPERYRFELDVVLPHGVPTNRILAVDKSPAIIATFSRSLSLLERAGIQRAGILASRACQKWANAGIVLEAAHFDFCANAEGYYEGSPRQEFESIARSGIIDNARIAVTILKGREGRKTTKEFDRSALLMAAIANGLRGRSRITLELATSYQNGPSPMLWTVFQIKGTVK
jgi:hypothetical protein